MDWKMLRVKVEDDFGDFDVLGVIMHLVVRLERRGG
jgi:hypothetical protein